MDLLSNSRNMTEFEIENLRQKNTEELSDKQTLELLKHDIESKGRTPTSEDLVQVISCNQC